MQIHFPPSRRALASLDQGPAWDLMQSVKRFPPYDPVRHPEGLINLSGALNGLMDDWTESYVAANDHLDPKLLSYGALAGSPELLGAAARFFNRFFAPRTPVEPGHLLAANGVTSLIDLTTWTLCDAGDAVLYPTPNFYMLDFDLKLRGAVQTVPFSTSDLTDPFGDAAGMVALAERAAMDAERTRSLCCKVLFLCNPANPQGRCYSKKTLEALAAWCTHRGMHLVVDEIYAMSSFRAAGQDGQMEGFTSILSVGQGSSENVHCLYGLSKDFNMGGLRMAFLVTRNRAVRDAASKATFFTWLTAFSDAFAARFLGFLVTVEGFLDTYRPRLARQYEKTARALEQNGIPFAPANAGLFVFIDLGQWIRFFERPAQSEKRMSPELRLCEWLIRHGVFLSPGEFSGSDRPGWFRLVFTEFPEATVLAIERIRSSLDLLENGSVAEGVVC